MIYNPIEVFCGICGLPGPFFATICDNAVGHEHQSDESKTFTANSGVQMVFLYRAECSAITAYHSCD